MIEVSHFSKTYGSFTAVDDLSFTVAPGQILGLVGPNGAGKTTTLRTLAGIIPPGGGTLRIANHDISRDALAARQVTGYIPDDPRLFDSLTVREHLDFIAAAYGVSDGAARAESLLDFFDLQDKRDHVVQGLSRGMRQKVAIACAYLHNPQAILFDEPLTGLDPAGIRAIKTSMHARAADGAAIIISSHLLGLVETLCTHLLVLDHGRQLCFGPMDDVLRTFEKAGENTSLEDVFFSITRAQEHGTGR